MSSVNKESMECDLRTKIAEKKVVVIWRKDSPGCQAVKKLFSEVGLTEFDAVEIGGSSASLKERFQQKATALKTKTEIKPDNKTLLSLYANYKQANVGDCNVDRPSGWTHFEGRNKLQNKK